MFAKLALVSLCATAAMASYASGSGYSGDGSGYDISGPGNAGIIIPHGYGVRSQGNSYGSQGNSGARYPADVLPQSCPNYPYCHNNPTLYSGSYGGGSSYGGNIVSSGSYGGGIISGGGSSYGGDIVSSGSGYSGDGSGYDISGPGNAGIIIPHGYGVRSQGNIYGSQGNSGARYPADVLPQSCPNYPYCHNNPTLYSGSYGGDIHTTVLSSGHGSAGY